MDPSQPQLGSVHDALPAPEDGQNLDQAISALAQSGALPDREPSGSLLHEQMPDLDDFLDAVSQFSEDVSEALPFLTPGNRSLTDCSFETSGSFFPEKYVMAGPLYERMAIHLAKEVERTATARIDEYYLLFAKDSRHWSRVTVTASTTKDGLKLSKPASSRSPAVRLTLPGLVRPKLEAMLDAIDLYSSVTNISVRLETNDEGDITFNPTKAEVHEDFRAASTRDVQRAIEEIEYRGLPQYLESEVIVLTHFSKYRFLVLLESRLCVEYLFPFTELAVSDPIPNNTFLADMKLLLMAQGCPGVAEFVGVVLSDDRRQLRSYLTLYRGQCSMSRMMLSQPSKTISIPWKRRQRWIRQAITLVAEVHKRGIIIGFVDASWIEVDASDNIHCSVFTSRGNHIRNQGGCLPPELRRHAELQAVPHAQELNLMSDIFQLGLFIWMVAQQIPLIVGNGIFCTLDQCPKVPRCRCAADHTNPIRLPACSSSDVPVYVDTVISYCRQEEPFRRKSAAALLELLPFDDVQNNLTADPESRSALQDISHESRMKYLACDECGQEISREHYHCNFCHEGDFDLCLECISLGIHCLDNGHKLSYRVFEAGRISIEPSGNASTG